MADRWGSWAYCGRSPATCFSLDNREGADAEPSWRSGGGGRHPCGVDLPVPVYVSVLHAAHPDDENNALLAYLARGVFCQDGLLSLTRGDGGQNRIGPELFEALGVIRTEELLAARRVDGAEQFFTRAYDFGYSKSSDETLAKWGHEEILGGHRPRRSHVPTRHHHPRFSVPLVRRPWPPPLWVF